MHIKILKFKCEMVTYQFIINVIKYYNAKISALRGASGCLA